MASGLVNRTNRPNTWLLRPLLQRVKKALANPEPSTHGPSRWARFDGQPSLSGHCGHAPIFMCNDLLRMPSRPDEFGSLALASLDHTYRNLVPTFPQRSLPWLLTTAACGGLRSAPDCRPRRASLISSTVAHR